MNCFRRDASQNLNGGKEMSFGTPSETGAGVEDAPLTNLSVGKRNKGEEMEVGNDNGEGTDFCAKWGSRHFPIFFVTTM